MKTLTVPKGRIEALSQIVAMDNQGKFVRIIDFPAQGYTQNMIDWANQLKEQIEHAIKTLKNVDLPIAQIEDQNLLNYLELLMGKEMTPFPRPIHLISQEGGK